MTAQSDNDVADVLARFEACEITKMQACRELGIGQLRFEHLMRQHGIGRLRARAPRGEGLRSWDVSERERREGEARWDAAMRGLRYDAFRVSADPRRPPTPVTVVPRVSPMGDI